MARATVLGKRKASADPAPVEVSSRKKRALRSTPNDENADPEYLREEVRVLSSDELDDPFAIVGKSAQRRPAPAKHTKVALSPAKARAHCINTKDAPDSPENTQLATPKTPRHRDALQRVLVSVTPRHRGGQTPRTPRSTPNSNPTVYACARRLFTRSSASGPLVGREEERAVLKTFIQTGIDSKSGRCLYVSGPPGTGKSALVSEVSKEFEGAEGVRSAYINCMSIKNSQDMYEKLVGELCGDDYSMESDAITTLKTIFLSKKGSHGMFVVTLDEIDHLLTLDLEILYTLFEWALTRSPRLILVGIANALDLTDRFLPRLKARNLAPQLLPFLPYTVPQIASVITTKLNTLLPANSATPDFTPVLHPAAIQFCAKKIATQAGDLRKAFDIVRRSIDLIETETKAKHQREADSQAQASPTKPLGENANLASPRPTLPTVTTPSEFLGRLTAETAPRATIAHVARITALAFSNGTAQRLQSLNLQQKAALCALVSVERKTTQLGRDLFSTPSKSANAVPTIRKAYDTYRALCRRDNALHPLTATEFADVIGSLETVSLVRGGDGKSVMGMGLGRLTPSKKVLRPEDRRVISCVSEKEVEGCLEGAGGAILRGLLRGD